MRKKGIVFLGLAAILFFMLPYLFLDAWVENSLEKYASSVNGARVEIENLSLSLLHPALKWSRLQITDPQNTFRNTLETGECEISFVFLPLLQKKFIADNLSLQGLVFNTPRSGNGALETPHSAEPTQGTGSHSLWPENPFRKIDTDSLLATVNLTSPAKMDSLKKTYRTDLESLLNEINQLPDKAEFDSARAELKHLRVKDLKTLDDVKAAYDRLSRLYTKLDKTKQTITLLREKIENKYTDLQKLPGLISEWTEADYQSIQQVSGDLFSHKSATNMLLGPETSEKLNQVGNIVRGIRHLYQKYHRDRPPKEKPPRGKGQTFHFGDENHLPDLWIRRIELSGFDGAGREFTGLVKNLTTNQDFVGEATTVSAASLQETDSSLTFSAVLDYRGGSKAESATLVLNGLSLQDREFTENTFLPHRLSGGSADISADFNFQSDNYTHKIDFTGSNIIFDFSTVTSEALDENLKNTLREIASAVKNIHFQVAAVKRGNDRSLIITSDVDDLIADKLATFMTGTMTDLSPGIQNRIRSNRDRYQAELDSITTRFKTETLAPLSTRETDLGDIQKVLKEKRNQLEKEITKQQGDLLKKLFH